MSWDVYVARFDNAYQSFAHIPDDSAPLPMGPAARVRERISEVFPHTDWSDPTWGMWAGPAGSIEFNMGKVDPVDGFMLHVRAGDVVVVGIVQLAEALKGQAFDAGHGDLLRIGADGSSPGLTQWRRYRDQVLNELGPAPS